MHYHIRPYVQLIIMTNVSTLIIHFLETSTMYFTIKLTLVCLNYIQGEVLFSYWTQLLNSDWQSLKRTLTLQGRTMMQLNK